MGYNKETGLYEGWIYKIVNNVNGYVYIGQTRDTIQKRWQRHTCKSTLKAYGDKYNLYKAFIQYGINAFNIEPLEKYATKTKADLKAILNERETCNIIKYKMLLGSYAIYNMNSGGDYCENFTVTIPVIQYDLSCNEIARFSSIREAGDAVGVIYSSIGGVVANKKDFKTCGGYIWRKQEAPLTIEEKRAYRIFLNTMPIKQYSWSGRYMQTFNNVDDVLAYLHSIYPNAKRYHILRCCNKKERIAYGYIWRYEDDELEQIDVPKNSRKTIEKRNMYTGELLECYPSAAFAGKVMNIQNVHNISRACRLGGGITFDFYWCYQGEYSAKKLQQLTHKPICQFDFNNNLVNIYPTMAIASKDTSINRSDIGSVCSGKLNTAGGFYWRFAYSIDPNIINTFLLKQKGGIV